MKLEDVQTVAFLLVSSAGVMTIGALTFIFLGLVVKLLLLALHGVG